MPVSLDSFYTEYQQALDQGDAAAFVGAGLSIPAGFPGWKDLLRDIASDLGLDIDEETDLIALAQYHVNHTRGRTGINRKLMDEFTRDARDREEHALLATLPLSSVWTTNYDHLLEDAFRAAHKRVDRKVTHADLGRTLPKRDVVIYKMHGDIDRPDEAVLTKSDYERYNTSRQLFSVQLAADLVSKTFLFLGLSLTDPNINYVLGRVRSLVGDHPRDHYWITRNDATTARDAKRQTHRIEDLKTYGIRTVLVSDYAEQAPILRELNRRVHRKHVFVSGSAHDYSPLGETRALQLLRELGRAIIDRGYSLVSGMGLGVGDSVSMGAIEAVYRTPDVHLDERILLRPFPQTMLGPDRAAVWERYRRDMLSRSGAAIFVLGNKLESGAIVQAAGVRAEFEIARSLKVYPIPLGVTGYVAQDLAAAVLAELDAFYGALAPQVRPHLESLSTGTPSNAAIIDAVVSILKLISPR